MTILLLPYDYLARPLSGGGSGGQVGGGEVSTPSIAKDMP